MFSAPLYIAMLVSAKMLKQPAVCADPHINRLKKFPRNFGATESSSEAEGAAPHASLIPPVGAGFLLCSIKHTYPLDSSVLTKSG